MGTNRRVKVRCTVFAIVDIPDDWTREQAEFAIEENSCPYTGRVGAALDKLFAEAEDADTCAACPEGRNEIVEWYEGNAL